MMTEWNTDPGDWIPPGWRDDGRRAAIRDENEIERAGRLVEYDMTPGPDELPMFHLVDEKGENLDLYGADYFRFID